MESTTMCDKTDRKGFYMNKLGWIGVGIMGSRMSKHLLGGDNELYIYDIAPANVEKMVN